MTTSSQPKIHIYYGYGKGKTTSGIGLAVRAVGAGHRVAIVQFDKGYDGTNEHYSERHVLRGLQGLDLFPTGCERMMSTGGFRFKNRPEDFEEAKRGLQIAHGLIEKGTHHLVILDEILAAVMTKLISQEDVLGVLNLYEGKGRPFELVITGHQVWDELVARADLVTEMRKVKHYFDKGLKARQGIEF